MVALHAFHYYWGRRSHRVYQLLRDVGRGEARTAFAAMPVSQIRFREAIAVLAGFSICGPRFFGDDFSPIAYCFRNDRAAIPARILLQFGRFAAFRAPYQVGAAAGTAIGFRFRRFAASRTKIYVYLCRVRFFHISPLLFRFLHSLLLPFPLKMN